MPDPRGGAYAPAPFDGPATRAGRSPGGPISTRLSGTTTGLKAHQRHALERIYRRSVPPEQVITTELAHFMAGLSKEMRRQVGVILDRRGRVVHVVVGDAEKLVLPDLGRQRAGRSRFRGLRLVHTHVGGERLTRDDLTDLALLQLDLVGVLQPGDDGLAASLELAHLVPPSATGEMWEVLPPVPVHEVDLDFQRFVADLEDRFAVERRTVKVGKGRMPAVAVHVTTGGPDEPDPEESLAELRELARTADVEIVETLTQRRRQLDHRYVVGKGKLDQLVLASMQQGAELIIFDRDLTPGQARSIADATEAKVIDRTQLILDIFAQRATTRDGKLQVELAQLKYALPRLAGRNDALSRLMGGIGGRGPGETKLEIDRRRAKDRVTRLQRQIEDLGRQRENRRQRRTGSGVPTAAIVGYTNAGKSTLLNALTGSKVLAEDKLFATLDPTARRLRFPDETELVVTDTVGFIRDLPKDLVAAFMATLEELRDADLLVHVVDISSPHWEDHMASVERVLVDLEISRKKQLVVFNKVDRLPADFPIDVLCRRFDAVATCAIDRSTLEGLSDRLVSLLGRPELRGAAPEAVFEGPEGAETAAA